MKLGDVSPLAGMLTGKGAMGKLIAQGFGGIIPAAIARSAREEDELAEAAARREAADQRESSDSAMKKGGVTKAKGWGKARGARKAKLY